MPDAIMLFAAGFGTRMGALTSDRPKPLIEVAGQPLIEHALSITEAAGLNRRVVNTHYLADQIEGYVSGRSGIEISHESPDILDTGGGLRQALPFLGSEPVFALNTDAVWTGANPLLSLATDWDPSRMDALLLCLPENQARGRSGPGDFGIDAQGRLHRNGPFVYTGAQILKTTDLLSQPPGAFSLNKVWDVMAARGRLFGTRHEGGWCDVGHPAGIAEAEEMLRGATV